MSLHDVSLFAEPGTQVKRAVRRLRWFRRAFMEQVASVSRDCDIAFDVDTTRLAEAFLDWSAAFEQQKPTEKGEERAYVDFAAGMMLERLLRCAPLTARAPLADPSRPAETPEALWPEGYACVVFCLNVRRAVLAQEYGETVSDAPAMSDLRGWASFRENVEQAPERAIAFLQHFAGLEPDWSNPDQFRPGRDPARPRLRLVGDNEDAAPTARSLPERDRPVWPEGVTTVILDLAAVSNSRELLAEELQAAINTFGVWVAPETVRDTLLDQPLGAAMTHVALATGQLCPGSFERVFRDRLARRYGEDLKPRPGAREVVARLSSAGVAVRVAVVDPKSEAADIISLLGFEGLADLVSPTETAKAADLAGGGGKILLASDEPARLEKAAELGIVTHAVWRLADPTPFVDFPLPRA